MCALHTVEAVCATATVGLKQHWWRHVHALLMVVVKSSSPLRFATMYSSTTLPWPCTNGARCIGGRCRAGDEDDDAGRAGAAGAAQTEAKADAKSEAKRPKTSSGKRKSTGEGGTKAEKSEVVISDPVTDL